MNKQPIEGKVAGILNERELLINVGTLQGVLVGMKFRILADQPTEVFDPDSGDLLGVVDREKVRVRATEVEDKFAVCQTYKTIAIEGGRFYGLTDSLTGFTKEFEPPRKIVETLRVEDSDYLPPIPESESYVKVGDRVIQLIDAG